MTTKVFASLARNAANNSPKGHRFGGNKVWLHRVWLNGAFQARFGIDYGTFQAMAWEANRAGLVELARADMVEAMDATDVSRSDLKVNGCTFNFMVV